MASQKQDQQRILVWTIPRSLSTVITKCMSFVPDVQIISEIYDCAYKFGPDRVRLSPEVNTKLNLQIKRLEAGYNRDVVFPHSFNHKICSYDFAKQTLENPFPDRKVIFCKDMAFAVHEKYHTLPEGYKHVFLIRHPHKLFVSWRNLNSKFFSDAQLQNFTFNELDPLYVPPKCGYGELYDLLQYVRKTDPNPVIIDADDLQNSPKSILQQFCQSCSIPYSDGILEWPASNEIVKTWIALELSVRANMDNSAGGFYDNAFNSSKFLPAKEAPTRDFLPPDVLPCVDVSMPLYKEMYESRIHPRL